MARDATTEPVGEIRPIRFESADSTRTRIDALTFAGLREMDPRLPMRGDFCVLAAVFGGEGEIMIDFRLHRLTPSTVVLIRPGVVHQWRDIADLEGNLTLFVPTAPVEPFVDVVGGPAAASCWQMDADVWRLASAGADTLRLEVEHASRLGVVGGGDIAPFLLAALLRRVAAPVATAHEESTVFSAFRDAVEQDFRSHHDVLHYADRLGYAARTLSRAAIAVTGGTAKAYVAQRLSLEARRMLAYEGLSATRVGERLGFTDTANFSAFFLREVGTRPGAWQEQHRTDVRVFG